MRREYDFSSGIRGKHVGKRIRIVGDVKRDETSETSDVTERFLDTQEVIVSWVFEETEGFIYKSIPGTVVPNKTSLSLRFELAEKNGDDENFEVIIQKTNGSFTLKADHPKINNREFGLKEFVSEDELVFYLHDNSNRAYFHLR